MFKKLIEFFLKPYKKYKFNKKVKELRKRDPYIYK